MDNKDIYIPPSAKIGAHVNHGVLFTFSQQKTDNTSKKYKAGEKEIFSWGKKNDLPHVRESIIQDNNIIGEMISTKRSLILGQGLQAYTEKFKDGVKSIILQPLPKEVEMWIETSDFYKKYAVDACNQLLLHANLFTGYSPSLDKSKIASIKTYKCRDIRVGYYDFGAEPTSFVYGDFSKTRAQQIYDYKTITALSYKKIDGTIQIPTSERMTHTKDSLFDNGIYAHPAYWGGEEWIDLSNIIPKFHKANIKNGYIVRYQVDIPNKSFLNKAKLKLAETKEAVNQCYSEAESAKKQFIKEVDKYLAGEENVGRALYTFFDHDDMGKKIEGVTITPIPVDLKDESLLKLFAASNQANISSQGLHPSIAGIETQGKLSSGSEMRNAIELYVKLKTPVIRSLLLEPFHHVVKINGWDKLYPGVKYGFEDIVLNKLDDEPTGASKELTPTATT